MTVSRRFEASEGSVGAARRFVTGVTGDAATEAQDSIAVMVSELATNALLHASGGFEVVVDRSEDSVAISVIDRGDGTPVLQSPTFSEPHGRGLRIVAALSDEWGISATSDGKAVWFRLSLQDSATTASTGEMAGATATSPARTRSSTSAPLPSSSAKASSAKTGPARSHHRTSGWRSPRFDRLAVRVRPVPVPVSA
jgi:anti-sigma regulatory factor (Ser/Thr protein kinase)